MERGALALPEAVRKMTSLPAEILGLADRGRIEVGLAADLVLFDPARVRATATYERPLSLAEGFDLVVVNGRIARSGGNLMDARAGRVLRPMPQAGPRN
jgi:N-acyl-D-amino-acid deacylase